MARPSSSYACTECGWTSVKWVGRCAECQAWGTVVERGAPVAAMRAAPIPEGRAARPITQLGTETAAHWPSGIAEFDRVLGGGIVPGAAILLSGEPGVGKSTLLLEVASRAARTGVRVLYVSAEESASQVRLGPTGPVRLTMSSTSPPRPTWRRSSATWMPCAPAC